MKQKQSPKKPPGSPKRATEGQKYVYVPPAPSFLFRTVLNPFYCWLAEFFPRWWIPNHITIFGILCTTTASLLLYLSMPADDPRVHFPWVSPIQGSPKDVIPMDNIQKTFGINQIYVFIFASVLNFLYAIADNCDGKQARRLGLSSSIGEYLDHGLDTVTAYLSTFVVAISLGGTPGQCAICQMLVSMVTVLSHVVHYRDNIFIWGTELFSVDEAMIGFGLAPLVIILKPDVRAHQGEFFTEESYGFYFGTVAWIGFILSQSQMMLLFVRRTPKTLVDGSVWAMIGTLITLILLCSYHGGFSHDTLVAMTPDFLKFIAVHMNYVSLWSITVAFCSSIVAHIPIFAKCRKLKHQSYYILLCLIPIAVLFAMSPVVGMLSAVLFHIVQVVYNCQDIAGHAEEIKRLKEKEKQ